MISKRKKVKLRTKNSVGANEEIPEGVYGVTSPQKGDLLPSKIRKSWGKNKVARASGSSKRKVVKSSMLGRIIPNLDINYEGTSLPADAANLLTGQLRNVIEIPDHLLKSLRNGSEARAKNYAELLLTNLIPSLLSFNAGNNYVQAVMEDGMGQPIDIDDSMGEVIKNMVRMDILVFYLKRMKMPLKYKKMFLEHMTKLMAENSVEKMDRELGKKRSAERTIKDLETIVARGMTKNVDQKMQDQQRARRERNELNRPQTAPKPLMDDPPVHKQGPSTKEPPFKQNSGITGTMKRSRR